jgi:hypothetical protein
VTVPAASADPVPADTVQRLQERIRAMQAASLGTRTLPTDPAVRHLLPGGALKAGAAYAVPGSPSLAMLLLAGPSAAGGWTGVVGVPEFGVEAAAGFGIDLARLVLVPRPGEHWLTVAAQLADVLPMVLVQPPRSGVAPGEAARLASRLRQRGATLVVLGTWPQAEATLEITDSRWVGLGPGHGYLTGREAEVEVTARGQATDRQRVWISDGFLTGGRSTDRPDEAGAPRAHPAPAPARSAPAPARLTPVRRLEAV